MKTLKLALVGLIGLVSSTATLTAQAPPGGDGRGPGPGNRVSAVGMLLDHADELELDEGQRGDLEEVLAGLAAQTEEARSSLSALRESGDRETMRSQARPLMQQLRAAEQDALTRALGLLHDDQRAIADRLLDEFRAERPRRGRRRGPGPSGAESA